MPTLETEHIRVTFLPAHEQILLDPGETILGASQRLGLTLAAPCGGSGNCGKCRMLLKQGRLDETVADRERLSAGERRAGVRLACQAVPDADCVVEIPESKPEKGGEILVQGIATRVAIHPAVRRFDVRTARPDLAQGASDAELLLAALPAQVRQISLRLLRQLPGMLRRGDWQARAIVQGERVIDLLPVSAASRLCGLAIDLGTTTVVMKWLDLESGEILATAAQFNDQKAFGADVIARIAYANAHGVEPLQSAIIGQLNDMIAQLERETGGSARDIYRIVVAGNTVMQHLFCGLPPRHLAEMPYVPVVRHYPPLPAAALGLQAHPEAVVMLMPGLGRFVGGDTAAVLLTLAAQLQGTWLAVDIGTNGEILLCHHGRIWTTSAAAGPAFEGAQISSGMRAVTGAIDRVWWRDGRLQAHVIGEGKARGICGSGLIDAAGALLEAGWMDYSGRLQQDQGEVVLRDGVALTQRDMREIQLAKGAIAAAIALLLRAADVSPHDLENLYLAGAFGQYIRKEMALRIGLLPPLPAEKIHFIGNAACAGAELALISTEEELRMAELARQVQYVEVAAQEGFQELFAENMFFPH